MHQFLVPCQRRLCERGAKPRSPPRVRRDGLCILWRPAPKLVPTFRHNLLCFNTPLQESLRGNTGSFTMADDLRAALGRWVPH
jgi:hypothetical protein